VREKIRMFVDEVLRQIPAELPDDEVAFEVATRIAENVDLVPRTEWLTEIIDDMTEYGVNYSVGKKVRNS